MSNYRVVIHSGRIERGEGRQLRLRLFPRSLVQRMAGHGGPGPARTAMVATQAGHMAAPASGGGANIATTKSPDSETTLDGNAVVVEEQMMKIAETRMDFETMVGLYQKSLGLLRMASRSPGR